MFFGWRCVQIYSYISAALLVVGTLATGYFHDPIVNVSLGILLVGFTVFLGIFRPENVFFAMLATIPFESVRMDLGWIPITLHPYQFLVALLCASILIRIFLDRRDVSYDVRMFDVFPIAVALGGFFSAFNASDTYSSFRQAVIVGSFVAIYFLTRRFLRRASYGAKVIPYVCVGSIIALAFSVWQGFRLSLDLPAFEAMPGRVNAWFSEPDWFGMFILLCVSLSLTGIFSTLFGKKSDLYSTKRPSLNQLPLFIVSFLFLWVSLVSLILTVSRSAWFASFLLCIVFVKLVLVSDSPWDIGKWQWKKFAWSGFILSFSWALAIFTVNAFHLTRFDLSGRAESALSGMQRITVSCNSSVSLPSEIRAREDLDALGCRQIRLEDVDSEQLSGRYIGTILRPDPSIGARREARSEVFSAIRDHWFFGIGWGNIGRVLGTDDRGNEFNASNALYEVWLGSGVIGALSFVLLWILIPITSFRNIVLQSQDVSLRLVSLFYLTSWVGLTVFNFFNSGILLGFFWVWIGGIGMLFPERRESSGSCDDMVRSERGSID